MARGGGIGKAIGKSVSGLASDPILNTWIAFEFIFAIFYLLIARNLFRSMKLWGDRVGPYILFLLAYIFAIVYSILTIVSAVMIDKATGTWQFDIALDIMDPLTDLFLLCSVTTMLYHRRSKFTAMLSLTSLPVYRYVLDWVFIGLLVLFIILSTALDGAFLGQIYNPLTYTFNWGLYHGAIATYDIQVAFLVIALAWVITSALLLRFAMGAQQVRDAVTNKMAFIVGPLLGVRAIDAITQLSIIRTKPPLTIDARRGAYIAHIIIANSVYFAIFIIFITLAEKPELWTIMPINGGNPEAANMTNPTGEAEVKPFVHLAAPTTPSTLPYGQPWPSPAPPYQHAQLPPIQPQPTQPQPTEAPPITQAHQ